MFIGDQVRAAVSTPQATARLAGMASGEGLTRASRAAWTQGAGRAGLTAVLPGLAKVRSRGPLQRGAVSMLTLRWEALVLDEQLFPVLDADIAMIPDGDQATLVGLDGVYRIPPGSRLAPEAIRQAAATTIASLLDRIASELIARPAAGASPRPHRMRPDHAPALGSWQAGG
jgi:hypothetical protein